MLARRQPVAGLWRFVLDASPWLLVLAVAVVLLTQAGTPVPEIGRYAVYWSLGLTLPGVLVARATVGSRGSWPEDIALGAVTGLALELVCFVLWSMAGLQQWLWIWPLLVLAVFAVVPRLRRHWRVSSPLPLPRLWSWGVASAIGLGMVSTRQIAFAAPLPPSGGVYYQDLPWHLSIVHELTRSFPPQVPQMAGGDLRYHWFSHVHLAAAHLTSGVPEASVVLRLWIFPLLVVTALMGARLAMELSGRWWSGPVAAWALLVLQGTNLLPVEGEVGVLFPLSPSQLFLVPVFLGVVILIVRALRGVALGPGWALLALLLVVAAGTKPTALPLVLAGAGLAGLSLLVQRRRQWLAALSVAGIVAAIFPVSFLAVSGSDSGSRISLVDFVELVPLYHWLTGEGVHRATGPILPEGVNDLSTRSLVILAILLLTQLVANLGRLVPLVLLGSRRLRNDPALWFTAGVLIAGWIAFLVLSHPGNSQAYFLRLANAVALVLGAWALAAAIPPGAQGGRRVGAVLAVGTLLGAAVVALGRAVTPALPEALAAPVSAMAPARKGSLLVVVESFAPPLAVLCVAALLGVVVWVALRRRFSGLRGWGLALLLAALVLGGPVPATIESAGESFTRLARGEFEDIPGYRLSDDAGAAMAWVDGHVPGDAVVATNRHCAKGPSVPGCQSLAFWTSGLGGRRTVLEGWGYLSSSKSWWAPSPFPERLAVNDAVFTDPDEQSIGRLRRDYGASWLVADTSAGPVSPRLSRFATARFSSGEVTVYELP
jgi:hypothetical protein